MSRLSLAKDKRLAPSHPWVQARCHLLQCGVIILAAQSITYYMLALCASHSCDFLCLLKERHITLQRGNTVHFPQAGSAAISIAQSEIKHNISVCRERDCCQSKVYFFVSHRIILVFSLHLKSSPTENKVIFSEDRCAEI